MNNAVRTDYRITGCLYLASCSPIVTVICLDKEFEGLFNFKPSVNESIKRYDSLEEFVNTADGNVDTLVVLTRRTPSSETLEQIYRFLSDEGVLYLFLKSRVLTHKFKNRLNNSGLHVFERYLILPNLEDPRWFVPFSKSTLMASTGILKPSGLKPVKQLLWKIFKIFGTVGLPHLVAPCRLLIAGKRESSRKSQNSTIKQMAAEILSTDDLNIILYTGAYGCYQKYTAQIMDSNGKVLAYAKIGHSDQGKSRIQHEAKILSELSKVELATAELPRILYFGNLDGSQDKVLIQTASPYFTDSPRKLHKRHVEFLSELFLKTAKPFIFNQSSLYEKLITSNSCLEELTISNLGFESLKTLLKSAFGRIMELFDGKEIFLGLSHGDFFYWNILWGKDKIFVYDWEVADKHSVPLYDLNTFTIYNELWISATKPKQLSKILHNGEEYHCKAIRYYKNLLSNKCGQLDESKYLLVFLYQMIMQYLSFCDSLEKNNFQVEKPVKQLLKTLCYLLKDILK